MYVVDLLADDAGFRNGLVRGTAALLIVTAVAVVLGHATPARRSRAHHPLRLAAIATVLASVTALDRTGRSVLLSDRLVWGVVLLMVLPVVVALVVGPGNGWGRLAGALVAIPGAVVVASAATLENDADWVGGFVAAVVVVGGILTVDFDEHNARPGLPPVLLAVTALGMWTTVPDTEQVLVVVGVLLPLALLGWPVVRAAEGAAAYGVVGLLAWVAAVGGRGRPGSVVGAVACLGIFLVEPLVRRLWRGRAVRPGRPFGVRSLASAAVHCGVVLLAARVAGLRTSAGEAAAISAAVLAAGGVAMALVLAPRPARPSPAGERSPTRNGATPSTP